MSSFDAAIGINLPWFITIHATLLVITGVAMVLKQNPAPAKTQSQALLGIATTGLGLSYLLTSYMPVEQNQFLHASVPARLILSAMMFAKVLVGGEGLTCDDKKKLWGLAIYDGLGGLFLGYYLGAYNGKITG